MLELTSIERILCIGAHCDDIEIGCGATLLSLGRRFPHATVDWVVLASNKIRAKEAQKAAMEFTNNFQKLNLHVKEFKNGYFPYVAHEIKDFFESLKKLDPNIIFTHYREDLHQDHRVASELTWNTFRSHLILEYEIPKWDPDLSNPNFLVEVSAEDAKHKCGILSECFASQKTKRWFSEEVFLGLMAVRGVHAGTSYAEGFYARKAVLH